MDSLVAIEFYILMGIPFVSAASTIYLARMVKDAISPPVLLVLLTIEAVVVLICSSWLAILTIRVRFFGLTNPPEFLPLTLLMLIAPLAMINVIAFVLWRANGDSR